MSGSRPGRVLSVGHVVEPDQTTSDMCVEAAKKAIEAAGVKVEDIDLIITGTTTPDLIFPNISTIIQHRLGIPACPAFSLEAACTGFIYALTTADKFIKTGDAKCALVMGGGVHHQAYRLVRPQYLRAVW